MDSKEVWNDAYNDALDEGMSEEEAASRAHEAVADHLASQINDAMDRMKYDEA